MYSTVSINGTHDDLYQNSVRGGGEVNYKIHHYSPLEYIIPDQRKACSPAWEIDQIGCIVCCSHVYVAL